VHKPFVIGHRGCPERAPENSLKGLREAVKAGVDFVEVDVRACRDGLVVIHDPDLRRVAGVNALVRELSLERLRGFVAEVPTLEEFLDLAAELDVRLVVDLKERGIERRVVDLMKERGLLEPSYLISFKHEVVRRVKEVCPRARTGAIVVCRPLDLPSLLRSAKVDALFMPGFIPGVETLDEEVVSEVHREGLKVVGDPVNDEDTLRRALELGLDGIGTDKPYEIVKALRSLVGG